jgi:arsenate reductase (thioredoxin)
MEKIKVLFICVHNSARSQMAEAFLNNLAGDKFYAESAGIEPGVLNPVVVKTMGEEGVDISGNKTKGVFDFYKEGRRYNYVITVCDQSTAEKCPIFLGVSEKISWDFEDPASFAGTENEKLAKTRIVRDKIKESVLEFVNKVTSDIEAE